MTELAVMTLACVIRPRHEARAHVSNTTPVVAPAGLTRSRTSVPRMVTHVREDTVPDDPA